MEDMHKRCKQWIELQFQGERRLPVHEIIAKANELFGLHKNVIDRIVARVLYEVNSASSR